MRRRDHDAVSWFEGSVAELEQAAVRVGVDPALDREVVSAAAVGVALRAWREAAELWHAGSVNAVGGGEMLRANVAATRIAGGWLVAEAIDWRGLAAELSSPDRELPDGRTIGELDAGGPAGLEATAGRWCALFGEFARCHGRRAALLWLAAAGAKDGGDWWGAPTWGTRVETFMAAIDDPGHPHWLAGSRPGEPEDAHNRVQLRLTLLAGPDGLSSPAADWLVAARIGSIAGPHV